VYLLISDLTVLVNRFRLYLTGSFEQKADCRSSLFLGKNNLDPEVAAVPNSVVGNAQSRGAKHPLPLLDIQL
jgi:hypothetical protein